ncbi:hypothetical protein DRW41_06810 [Neobacillus piezotolerans]|uniref:Tetratricopeptide repeat protein n=1 Tax=Neobacillus piezotolerans TaxID=2259171 RepID=A0A3D8GT52_9BACI|nr:hypothetical protein [Neobacillus piezotolerans]RDU37547.1 hypothetical protein DRW41_06810 [Neobacillus piezotolerans]
MKENVRLAIFVGVFIFSVIILFASSFIGNKENQIFIEENKKYELAKQQMNNPETDRSIELLMDLQEKYNDNYNVLRYMGLYYGLKGDFEKGVLFTQRAVEKRPFLAKSPGFCFQFGEMLFFYGDYKNSKAYLELSLANNIQEEHKLRIQQLIAEAEARLQGEGK